MPTDPNLDQAAAAIEAAKQADATEDANYEATIAELRSVIDVSLAELNAAKAALTTAIDALEARIAALE